MCDEKLRTDGTITFVIPVRDARGVEDWDAAMRLLQGTVASCLNQQGGLTPRVAIGASRSDQLPQLPEQVTVARVDHDWAPLPDDVEHRMPAIRRDKGLRVAAALQTAQPRGHIMVVDWDDLVSPSLASWVAAHPQGNGWFAESAYVFNEGPAAMKVKFGAHRLYGSTIIQRWDLARVPEPGADLDLDWVDDVYGSHVRSVKIHSAAGQPLAPLPFPVGAYRVGAGQNVSGSTSPFSVVRDVLHVRRRLWPQQVRPRAVIRQFAG